MEQTRLLLASARENYSLALNTLCLVQTREIPLTIWDTIYAYMVAKDWCEWIKNPNASESPLSGKTDDYQPLLDMFEGYVEKLESQLTAYQDYIEELFRTLNPNLVNLWHGENRKSTLKEDTRLFYRSLRYTAQMFEGKNIKRFNKILDEKDIPPMSELNAKTNS